MSSVPPSSVVSRLCYGLLWYRHSLRGLIYCLSAALLIGLPVLAQDGGGSGIRITFNTSAQVFKQPLAATAGKGNRAPEFFTASVSVTNRSKSGLGISFSTAETAKARLVFTVSNQAGQELWRSTESAMNEQPVEEILRPGSTWKRTVRVPLVIGGEPLPPGRYVLRASAGESGPVQVSTFFEVLGVDTSIPENPTIAGVVWGTGFSYVNGVRTAYHQPVAGAYVTIHKDGPGQTASNSSTVWEGSTDAQGRFALEASPGTFQIHAILQAQSSDPRISLPAFQDGNGSVKVGRDGLSQPVIMFSYTEHDQRAKAVQKVTVTSLDADRVLIEADAFGVIGTVGFPALKSSHITSDGVLILDAVQRSALSANQPEANFKVRAVVPKLPGVYKIRVRAQQNSREATVGSAADL